MLNGGTCLDSDQGMLHVGSVWCHELGCTAFTWTRQNANVEMSFTMSLKFNLVLAVNSGAGRACPPTTSPTVQATTTPTNYPI